MLNFVYILECSDKTLYTGVTSDLEKRIYQHSIGHFPSCYTYKRRPIRLVYIESFKWIEDAIAHEKKFKKWSSKKKWAYINKDKTELKQLSSCRNSTHYKNFAENEKDRA